jgi:CheY-like chemotaxis protein/tRNA A-37 threonylcarbamoyl transferase component Bud32
MSEEDTTLFEIGELVGGAYEIRSVLGEGGMGRVYGAHDVALNRRVALKASWPSIEDTLLAKEAQAIASVRHPGMIDVYGAGTHRGIPFLVMEFLYGVNLETFLDKRRGDASMLTVSEVLDLLIPVADALAAVHRSGITHRDVKPANIMLTPNGRIVLMDFGLFTPESDANAELSGTPEYMAPESLTGKVDPRNAFFVDIYALGMTAYELLTGDVPFAYETPQEVVRAQVREKVPDIREERPDLSPRLAELVHEMLAKDPLERPQGMEAVVFRLRAAREALNVPVPVQEKFTALVVDDDAALGKLLGMYVTRAVPETQVIVVDDAERALVALRERPPDVMLVDLHMPRMNGIELCMMLRGMHLADQCTIVAVSAGARDADIDLLRQLGITRFVPKGAELGALLGPQIKELHQAWQRTARSSARPASQSPASSKQAAAQAASAPRINAAQASTVKMPVAREIQAPRRPLDRADAKSQAFETLLRMVADAVLVVDAAGEPQLWNKPAERTLGLVLARAPGQAWIARPGVFDETGRRPLPVDQRPIMRALRGENVDAQEITLTHPEGGELIGVCVAAHPLRDDSGVVVGAVAVFRAGSRK